MYSIGESHDVFSIEYQSIRKKIPENKYQNTNQSTQQNTELYCIVHTNRIDSVSKFVHDWIWSSTNGKLELKTRIEYINTETIEKNNGDVGKMRIEKGNSKLEGNMSN